MITEKKPPHEEYPRENPLDDPRQRTDWPSIKQTDKPWKGNPEKEQVAIPTGQISTWRSGKNRTQGLFWRTS